MGIMGFFRENFVDTLFVVYIIFNGYSVKLILLVLKNIQFSEPLSKCKRF